MTENNSGFSRRPAATKRAGRARVQALAGLFALLAGCGDALQEEGAEAAALYRGEIAAGFRLAGDWPSYNGDPAGTRYSPLTQIHTGNVTNLRRAWSYVFRQSAIPDQAAEGWQVTPLVVDGIMYLAAPDRIVALDAEAGEMIWRHPPRRTPSRRGLAYWPGERHDEARVYFTAGDRLIALNARTGRRMPSFGLRGEVELESFDALHAVPVVFGDLVVVAAGETAAGVIAFDARSGARRWVFDLPDRAGSAGFTMSVDVDRGLLFVTFGGSGSTADSRFANAVVALDVYTGALKWHFQTLRGVRWSAAPSAPPALLDAVIDGREKALLAWATPSGHMYVLDRVTGEPLQDIEERPPLSRVSFAPTDLVTAADTTEAHAAHCAGLVERAQPPDAASASPDEQTEPEAPGAPIFPGMRGAAGWGGIAVHPGLAHVYVNTMDLGDTVVLSALQPVQDDEVQDQLEAAAADTGVGQWLQPFAWSEDAGEAEDDARSAAPEMLPCQLPPWGRLLAVDALTGHILWQVPLGITESLAPEARYTGRPNLGGAMVTAGGLIFVGAADDERFRAFDSITGEELWSARLGISAQAVPISYWGRDGKQYVAVAAAGGIHETSGSGAPALIVFTLP